MKRRDLLRFGGPAVVSAFAGCLTGNVLDESEPEVGDLSPESSHPEKVYYPPHRTGMRMIGTKQQGNLTVGLSYTYAEGFWTVTGRRTQRVGVEDGYNAIHLMASVWHTETETVLPVGSGLRVRVEDDEKTVTERALWPMLSQQMGFHFGDNIEFPGPGEYTLVVDLGNTTIGAEGSLADSFADSGTLRYTFDFRRGKRNSITVEKRLSDRRGDMAAVSPMEMEMLPLSIAPSRDALPGAFLGEETSGDAVFVVTSEPVDDRTSVTVSPRTPYNQYLIPLMSLSMTIERAGSTVFEGPLSPAIGPKRAYHYRADVGSTKPGDKLRITVDSPPQAARHTGYENAFIDMPAMTITV